MLLWALVGGVLIYLGLLDAFNTSLLDARVGSPPSAAELLRRPAGEDWSAELLESHLSYPLLAYYRFQHEEQSWLAGLTTILDVAALIIVGMEGVPTWPCDIRRLSRSSRYCENAGSSACCRGAQHRVHIARVCVCGPR